MRRLTLVLVAVLALSLVAVAQGFPRAEFHVGYSYMRAQTFAVTSFSAENMSGVGGSFTFNFKPSFGMFADLSYNKSTKSGTDDKLTTYLFGPQFTYRGESRLSPFARFYVGAIHAGPNYGTTSVADTEWAYGMGGGGDVRLTQHLSARVFQVDYIRGHLMRHHQNNFRMSFGIVFKLGEKAQ